MKKESKFKLSTFELILFSMLGTLMFLSKLLLEFMPNVHLLGVLTIAFTIVYRVKALFPIYIMVFLTIAYNGFTPWLVPYLYLWAILWGATMLIPTNLPTKFQVPIYMILCGLHGILFGTMYAPFHALLFGLNFKGMITWIGAGLYWDVVHGISNFFLAVLVVPIANALKKLNSKYFKVN
jgi:energy-coupling factor transport system substrate-specific component